ncbi:xanthine dehydrogenase family protein molybdopterin-binding subunit [Pseudomonas sp. 5Ae-yellow]|uniref:xanthine dehydrogenase family protein molybdopterin-binding subunit n=1 Tax=Pseudomonas sp. 5Ae-yellow TaxID=2759848 RepID=UPI0015F63F27|nr:xanthine dehydrogenase family protein molybdopterin-binding subunit [Pseudomonas sp. 5Ae-yellow]MBA6420988.1 xanthine dehydrogenase family protein [Pseudomonas sp. 5Ae-yellow]
MMKHEVAALKKKSIGTSVLRREDTRLLTGRGRYIADLVLPGMLHAVALRSPFAHARILSVDVADAQALQGVEIVWCGPDVAELSQGIVSTMQVEGFQTTVQPVLANGIARFVGEMVAVVVASSRAIAEDAAQLIQVEYEELPAVTDVEAALAGEITANDTLSGNVVSRFSRAHDDLEPIFASSAGTVRGSFACGRVSACPIETRGAVAEYEWTTQQLVLWTATQMPGFVRTMISMFCSIPEHLIEVRVPDVGGGFGQKAHLHPEELLICLLSRELGLPVRWIEDRQENFLGATHAKQQRNEMALAYDEQGRFLALENHSITDGGAYNNLPWSQLVESHVGNAVILGVYKVPAVREESVAVATNKSPIGAYRGVGFTAGQIARETLIDRAARQLGLSPFEIRRRNVVKPEDFPFTNRLGQTHREGTYLQTIDLLEEMVNPKVFRQRQAEAWARGKYLGLGISVFNEVTGTGTRTMSFLGTPATTHDTATVRIDPTGKVTVTTSLASSGQGHETTLAQVAADALGVPVSDVVIQSGSTKHTYGFGAFASRGAVIGAGSIGRAASIVRERVKQLAGHLLEASSEDIVIEDGRVHVTGVPAKGMPFTEVVGAAYFAEAAHPPGFDAALEATAAYDPSDLILANGGHAAIVEIDAGTYAVKVTDFFAVEDCGTMINPMIVEGQIRGGIAQAIGQTLLEEVIYDDLGQLVTTTFMDYLIPTTLDVPDIQIRHLETPSPLVPGGVKGMGESAMISAPAAVVAAVNDALAHLGVVIETVPITPERIFRSIQERSVQ